MRQLQLEQKAKDLLEIFTGRLRDVYQDGLISVILYGSGSSGEFVPRHSNLNLLVVLKDGGLENLKKATGILNKFKFNIIRAVFFTEDFMVNSCDVFPIEFIDMKENYAVLYGKDVLKGISVDLKNLRFQCEHELKVKLVNLKQRYLLINKDKARLRDLLFRTLTSVIHILRNALRLKGKEPVYLKADVLKEIAQEFNINIDAWGKILAAKNKRIKLKTQDTKSLFIDFVKDLEKISDAVDRL